MFHALITWLTQKSEPQRVLARLEAMRKLKLRREREAKSEARAVANDCFKQAIACDNVQESRPQPCKCCITGYP